MHPQKMYFALRHTDFPAFITPTKCIWLVEYNHVNLKTLQLFLVTLILNYILCFRTPTFLSEHYTQTFLLSSDYLPWLSPCCWIGLFRDRGYALIKKLIVWLNNYTLFKSFTIS